MLVLLWKPTDRSPAGGRLHWQRILGAASCWGEHGAGSVGSSPVQRLTLEKSPDLAALHLQRKEWWPLPSCGFPSLTPLLAGPESLYKGIFGGVLADIQLGVDLCLIQLVSFFWRPCLCLHRKAAQTRGTLTPQPCLLVTNGCLLVARGLWLAGATKPLCTAGRRCQAGGSTKISTARVHGPVIS